MATRPPLRRRSVLPDTARLGTVELGCFRIREVLGRGSYGTVFLAEQEGFGREAVLKIAHARLLGGRDEELVRNRFAAELRAATQVNHPNVVTLFTAGETSDGLPAIAMEYVPGVTLESLLDTRAGQLDPSFLHQVFSQLISAVAAFHQASVIHRDLSPSNIIVGDDDRGEMVVKVLDFGVAKMGHDPGRSSVVGTPRYMAPEQVVGATSPASDIYAVGAILWWALTGQEFQGEIQTLEDVTEARLMGAKAVDIRRSAPNTSSEIAALLAELLAFEPTDRPTAAEFQERWKACRASLPEASALPRPSETIPPRLASSHRTARAPGLDCLIFDTDHVRVGLLRGFLTQQDCRPRQAAVADASATLSARPDVVLISNDLPGGAATGLLHRARTDAPGALIVALIGTERQRTAMIRAGADCALRIPNDLPHLVEFLDDARRDDGWESAGTAPHPAPFPVQAPAPTISPAMVESFMGDAPELLAEMAEALELQHAGRALQAGEQLRLRALELGHAQLAHLSTTCVAFADNGDFQAATGFIDELQNEYASVFQQLISHRAGPSHQQAKR